MRKKSILWTLAALLVFSVVLAGCSGGSEKADGGSEGGGGKKELKVWLMGDTSDETLIKQYEEKNPGVKVSVQLIPWGSAHDKLLTAVASKSGPDVVQMGTTWIPEFAQAGALLDLTPYLEQYPNLKQENYFDGAVQTMSYDDKVVSIPWYVETRVLFYRTDILAEVGYPEGPKTWDEMKDAGKKLAARGDGNYAITIDAKDMNYLSMFAWQNGSAMIDENRKPHFNEPEFMGAMEYLKSFYDTGMTPLASDLDLFAAFKDGQFPMFISGPWMIQGVKDKAPEIEGKWATTTLPAKENNASFLGGANMSVFNTTENADEAVKFISFMSEQESQLTNYDVAKNLPAVKSAWEDQRFEDPIFATFGKQLESAKPVPFIKEWDAISQEAIAAFEKITLGGADIKAEMDLLNQKATEILNKK
ncbi:MULTISPECIES: sugar ABC transporter substrate-binding protein [Paenibacillus]|uniref:sugar ABC transporter substrate-binding protein n=1 Tax=Paenibacillus TaxID=44249 RepID=UPI00188CD86E|nr:MULTISPECIES: sugar ABC transporter substrate-binding protein [Paenibacillus]MBX4152158.1 sugar ABC transporter substrate-binding protein [Paenibacillus lautus]